MEQKIVIPEGYELVKTSEFEYKIVKKEEKLPESWSEFCDMYPNTKGEFIIKEGSGLYEMEGINSRSKLIDKNLLPNKEYAKAILALCQLIQLRDCYRQGWKPDWNIAEIKYCINFHENIFDKNDANFTAFIFSFQSKEIRDKFYDNFKDLIEKIKPLFM